MQKNTASIKNFLIKEIYIYMMEDGLVTPEPIITNEYALDQINEALHASMDKRDLSGVIVPN